MKNNIIYTKDFVNYSTEYIIDFFKKTKNLKKGNINIALSGGSTPIPILINLKKKGLDWSRCNFFIVDERCVSLIDSESNYGNINNSFFRHIDANNIFSFFKEGLDYPEMINRYANEIISNVSEKKNEIPVFDLILLGMGIDGHTASLFPNTNALNNRDEIVVLNFIKKINKNRLTFTYPLILNAKKIIVFIKGKDKIEIMNKIVNSKIKEYPMTLISEKHNDITWIVKS
ncbi:6-phosphogluconolactonase [Tenacibaculum insulae]|uniref:6-phosphogluconolactonase n=1 Tax=Tenacibaculum insulae TaxID=2029677 RepID=UPI003AB52F50